MRARARETPAAPKLAPRRRGRARARPLTRVRPRLPAPAHARRLRARAAKLNEETQAVIVGEGVGILEFCEAAKLMVALPGGEGPICKVSLRGATEQNGLIDFYRAFLSEAFRTEGPVAEARAEQAAALAQVLGLSADEIASAQQGLGAQLCRGAILRALTDKGQLDDADRAFLQGVQGALGMDEALCDKLLLEMKAARVNSLVERMFEASDLTAAKVAAVRASCESLGLELGGSEVGLPQARLLRMLRAEVEACVERGEAPVEDTSRLAELQEAYSLPQAVAAREIEDLLAKRCGGHLLQAASALRRGNAAQVLHETEQLLRFNALNPFAVPSQAVQPNERAVSARRARPLLALSASPRAAPPPAHACFPSRLPLAASAVASGAADALPVELPQGRPAGRGGAQAHRPAQSRARAQRRGARRGRGSRGRAERALRADDQRALSGAL